MIFLRKTSKCLLLRNAVIYKGRGGLFLWQELPSSANHHHMQVLNSSVGSSFFFILPYKSAFCTWMIWIIWHCCQLSCASNRDPALLKEKTEL